MITILIGNQKKYFELWNNRSKAKKSAVDTYWKFQNTCSNVNSCSITAKDGKVTGVAEGIFDYVKKYQRVIQRPKASRFLLYWITNRKDIWLTQCLYDSNLIHRIDLNF